MHNPGLTERIQNYYLCKFDFNFFKISSSDERVDINRYTTLMKLLYDYLETISEVIIGYKFSDQGITLNKADKNSINSIVDSDHPYKRFYEYIFDKNNIKFNKNDTILLQDIKNPDSLVSACILSKYIKDNFKSYTAIVNPNYENFNGRILNPIAKQLLRFIDSINIYKDNVLSFLEDIVVNKNKFKGIWNSKSIIKTNIDYELLEFTDNYLQFINMQKKGYMKINLLRTEIGLNQCYWNKCLFCANRLQYSSLKNKSNSTHKKIKFLVKKMKYLNKFAEISHFNIIDNAISPEYLNYFSDQILNLDIKINYFVRSRIEDEYFEMSQLDKFRKSGMKSLLIGIETFNEDLLEKYNKRSKKIKNIEILELIKNIQKNGISPHLSFILNLPGSTKKSIIDDLKIIKYLFDSQQQFIFIDINIFSLMKNIPFYEIEKKYQLTKTNETADKYSVSYDYRYNTNLKTMKINEYAKYSKYTILKYLYNKSGYNNYYNYLLFLHSFINNKSHGVLFMSYNINPFIDK